MRFPKAFQQGSLHTGQLYTFFVARPDTDVRKLVSAVKEFLKVEKNKNWGHPLAHLHSDYTARSAVICFDPAVFMASNQVY